MHRLGHYLTPHYSWPLTDGCLLTNTWYAFQARHAYHTLCCLGYLTGHLRLEQLAMDTQQPL
jgi:hypothetical protein